MIKGTISIFIGSLLLLVLSTDVSFAQWEKTDFPKIGIETNLLLTSDNLLIAGTKRGLYLSKDSGQTWAQGGLMRRAITGAGLLTGMVLTEDYLFIADNFGVKRFTLPVEESELNVVNSGLNGDARKINALIIKDDVLFVATEAGVYKSINNAETWQPTEEIKLDEGGNTINKVRTLLAIEDTLFAGTPVGVFRSENNGETWLEVSLEEDDDFRSVKHILYSNGDLFVISRNDTDSDEHIYRSSDVGITWVEVSEELAAQGLEVYSFINWNDVYFASTTNGLMSSSNFGENWIQVNDGINNDGALIHTLSLSGGYLYAGTERGLYRSSDNANTWEQTEIQRYLQVNALAANNNMLYAGTEDGIFSSLDEGESWEVFYTPSDHDSTNILNIETWDDYVFAGTKVGLFRKNTNGTLWEKVLKDSVNNYYGISAQTVWQDTLYAIIDKRVYRSGDYGNSWQVSDEGLTSTSYGYGFIKGYDDFLYTAHEMGFFRSSDNGRNWVQAGKIINVGFVRVFDMIKKGNRIFVATDGSGINMSTDNGNNWIGSDYGIPSGGSGNKWVYSFALHNDILYADLYFSKNDGLSWQSNKEGLENEPQTAVNALLVNNEILYGGSDEMGVIKLSLSEEATSIVNEQETVSAFALHQNYPNPFNPATTITFSLQEKAIVSLKVYDITGREVATIASENLAAGTHSRVWNAGEMASGIYFYRLTAGNFTQTRKLTLIK